MKYLGHVPLCNHRADRGIFIHGFCLPLCARCTGIVCGVIGGIAAMALFRARFPFRTELFAGILLLLPTGTDGILEYAFGRESNNRRRLITGILCGIGCALLDRAIFGVFF